MRRFRLASLTLASSLLLTLSGCYSFCDEGWTFPRLFQSSRISSDVDCECNHAPWTPGMPVPTGQGPFPAPPPNGAPIPPITNVPATQPPHLFKVPQAPPVPYNPAP